MNIDICINIWGENIPVYALDKLTGKVVDDHRHLVVCQNGDIRKLYIVSYSDKGMRDDGTIYYKGCVRKLTNANACGHFTSVWFTGDTFAEAVGEFISKGGDLTI